MRRFLLLVAVVAAVGGILPASGSAQGPGPVSCGTNIQSPGLYALQRNCSGNGILISASDVTVLLKGHTMFLEGSDNGFTAANESNIRIQGPGTLVDAIVGVSFDHVDDSHVDYVKILGSSAHGVATFDSSGNFYNWDTVRGSAFHGFTLNGGNTNHLDNDTVTGNSDNGIYLASSSDNVVASNVVKGNGGYGVEVGNVSNGPYDGNTIRLNIVNGNGANGISLEDGSTSNSVVRNRAHGNGGYDLYDGNTSCGSNTWSGNVAGSSSLCQS